VDYCDFTSLFQLSLCRHISPQVFRELRGRPSRAGSNPNGSRDFPTIISLPLSTGVTPHSFTDLYHNQNQTLSNTKTAAWHQPNLTQAVLQSIKTSWPPSQLVLASIPLTLLLSESTSTSTAESFARTPAHHVSIN
jgi:hypothetical protein